ncbi:hypothetical protein CLV90_3195 [Maribacter spongiicola]|uniref:Uncharacterized protein n=1 Tax=Maribacter spongiicola TaxID=1206753 RepID=A0A4R7JUC8_9FLAO|nr:hypothetical protein [Maribacter spongiicola]TDT41962.1 hypothetical protein CLV90_3195 [Maribacter spongiicola]
MELIKLKVREHNSKGSNATLITDKFIESCTKLDASIFESLIDEDQYFENKDKYEFLSFLKAQFDHAKKIGLDKTIVGYGSCGACQVGCRTHEFFGADGKIRFAYLINQKDGEVKDIFNCNASSGWFKK